MNATTVAVDLAKNVFQLAAVDSKWKVIETHRLTRSQFERWFQNLDVSLVVHNRTNFKHYSIRTETQYEINRPGFGVRRH